MGETAAQLGPGTGLGLYSALGGGDGNLRQPLVRSLNLPWRSQAQDPTLFFFLFLFFKILFNPSLFYLLPLHQKDKFPVLHLWNESSYCFASVHSDPLWL